MSILKGRNILNKVSCQKKRLMYLAVITSFVTEPFVAQFSGWIIAGVMLEVAYIFNLLFLRC